MSPHDNHPDTYTLYPLTYGVVNAGRKVKEWFGGGRIKDRQLEKRVSADRRRRKEAKKNKRK